VHWFEARYTLAICIIILCSKQIFGCNFQYASMRYEWISARTMKFTIESQWRRNYTGLPQCGGNSASLGQVWGLWSMLSKANLGDEVDIVGVNVVRGSATSISFNPGDGTSYPIKLEVSEWSVAENFIHGFSYVYHTYTAPESLPSKFAATLSGCCWQATGNLPLNATANGGGAFKVTARLGFDNVDPSLIVRALPKQMVGPTMSRIYLPASSSRGAPATYYRLGQGSDERGEAVLPPAVNFNGPDYLKGLLTIDGAQLTAGREYPMVVEIAYRGARPSFIPYVFTILSVSAQQWAQKPSFVDGPVLTDPVSGLQQLNADGSLPLLTAYVGYEVFVRLRASTLRSGAKILKIRSYSLVDGAYLSNEAGEGLAGNFKQRIDWRWTPSQTQSGRHYACFEAVDDRTAPPLSSGQHCFAVDVSADLPQPALLSPQPEYAVECYMGSRVAVSVLFPTATHLLRHTHRLRHHDVEHYFLSSCSLMLLKGCYIDLA
jgi:hypothetical protein